MTNEELIRLQHDAGRAEALLKSENWQFILEVISRRRADLENREPAADNIAARTLARVNELNFLQSWFTDVIGERDEALRSIQASEAEAGEKAASPRVFPLVRLRDEPQAAV